MATLIKGSKLIDGKGGVIDNAAALFDGDRIVAVGRQADMVTGPEVTVVDAGDKTIMPGLIDAHVHMSHNGGPLAARESLHATDQQMMIQCVKNAQLAIRAGLTTVRDLGGKDFITVAVRDAIAGGMIPGPRVVSCAHAITTTGGHYHAHSAEVDNADEIRKAVRSIIKGGADCIKVFGSGGTTTPGSNPLAAQYNVGEFRTAADEAHRLGKHVTAHVHPTVAIQAAIEGGLDCLEHCNWLNPEGIRLHEPVLEEIIKRDVYVSLGMPAAWYRLPVDQIKDIMVPDRQAQLQPRYRTIRQMYDAGAKVVASSDAGTTSTRIDELGLLLEFLVNGLEIPAMKVIMSATGLAAEAVGLGTQTGVLEAGKKADLITVDGDPLEDITALQRVDLVIKDGSVAAQAGQAVL